MPQGDARIGSMFGKYSLKKLLGQGGMGAVYEAYDTSKNRTVALKILAEGLSRDERFRTRFQRESHAAAMLDEPHVIPIHDWGEIDGNLFIDMRMVRGRDLHELLRQGPIDPARAIRIIRQIASALDAAHLAGLVHRDVKPQNILITGAEDFAYLIDFGIAANRTDTRLTVAGCAIGSLAYMAPERFGDGPTTPAVDVYSLAGVLHEALTGEPPFRADSIEQLIAGHVSLPPPRPSLVNPRIPAGLDEVIARGMAKEPDDRYGSPGALGRAAERALGTVASGPSTGPSAVTQLAPTGMAAPTPSSTQPDTPSAAPNAPAQARQWLLPVVVTVVAVLLLAGIGVMIGLLARQNAGPSTDAAPESTRYTGYPVPAHPPSYRPEPLPPPPAPAPVRPASPPGVTGPDNSVGHQFCDDGYSLANASGFGTHSKRGSRATSCYFAQSVLLAYWNQYGSASRESRTVSAPGAVPCSSVGGGVTCNGNDFVLHCAAYGSDNWITCRGGNDAVVYLY